MNAPSRPSSEASPPRIASLAKLPVFLDLENRSVLVVGGTPGAAWKAELLAAAGAHVTVVTTTASDEMAALVGTPGRIRLEVREWTPGDLAGRSMVVGDPADDAGAAELTKNPDALIRARHRLLGNPGRKLLDARGEIRKLTRQHSRKPVSQNQREYDDGGKRQQQDILELLLARFMRFDAVDDDKAQTVRVSYSDMALRADA